MFLCPSDPPVRCCPYQAQPLVYKQNELPLFWDSGSDVKRSVTRGSSGVQSLWPCMPVNVRKAAGAYRYQEDSSPRSSACRLCTLSAFLRPFTSCRAWWHF